MSTAALTVTIVAVGVVTYLSRALFLVVRPTVLGGWVGRFLDAFPLALFVALAATGALAPDGELALNPGVAALVVGGVLVWRRSPVWLVMLGGYAAAVAARLSGLL